MRWCCPPVSKCGVDYVCRRGVHQRTGKPFTLTFRTRWGPNAFNERSVRHATPVPGQLSRGVTFSRVTRENAERLPRDARGALGLAQGAGWQAKRVRAAPEQGERRVGRARGSDRCVTVLHVEYTGVAN